MHGNEQPDLEPFDELSATKGIAITDTPIYGEHHHIETVGNLADVFQLAKELLLVSNRIERLLHLKTISKLVRIVVRQELAVGQNLPSVAVGAGYNYHNLLDANTTFGMVFATVSVPISDWWAGSHAIKRRKIEHQKAVEQLEDNSQLLQIRMQNAWNGVEEAYQQLLLAQRSIEQATENLRLNRNYYNAGISKMSDLLEAQMLYQQSCDRRTDAFADYQNKLLEYRQAIGQ